MFQSNNKEKKEACNPICSKRPINNIKLNGAIRIADLIPYEKRRSMQERKIKFIRGHPNTISEIGFLPGMKKFFQTTILHA